MNNCSMCVSVCVLILYFAFLLMSLSLMIVHKLRDPFTVLQTLAKNCFIQKYDDVNGID